jgi:iron complex transport system substrate-binding protein
MLEISLERQMSKRICLIFILLSAFITTSCSQVSRNPSSLSANPSPAIHQGAIELTDGLNRTVQLTGPAKRIVSLAPSNTEILFAVGAGEQVVGRDSYSDYPAEAQTVTDIGGGFGDLNFETIVSLKPDLVLASSLSTEAQIETLEKLGITVFALSNPTDFEGMYDNLRITAKLSGHEAKTEALIGELETRVTAIQKKMAATQARPLVFYELDGSEPDAPWTAGGGTFISTLIEMAGGQNLGDKLAGEWVQISAEELITQNPDVIILGDYTWGGVTPDQVATRAGWDSIAAVINDKVYTFDDNLVSRPGPRLVDGLESMAVLLHPELYP